MSTTARPTPFAPPAPSSGLRPLTGPVVLGCDGRGRSDAAPIAAGRIAARLGTRLEVAAVLPPLPVYPMADVPLLLPPEYETERKGDLADCVAARLEPILGSRAGWHLDVSEGDPGRELARVASERHASLIVVGTGGHRLLDRAVGDEVSLQVMRRASVPVLAVAPDQTRSFRHAVVGVDFSAASVVAARTALALLDPPAGEIGSLTLVHVRGMVGNHVTLPASWTAEYDASVGAMFARLRELLRPFLRDDVVLETRVQEGDVAAALLQTTRDGGGPDLVAVGTHGPGWVERLVVGSVATSTLRRATCSVLVAPTPPAADRVRLELRVAGQVALVESEQWAGALDEFTRRNQLRRARLEVSGPDVDGAVALGAEGYRFVGATFDPRDRRVELLFGATPDAMRHLTHVITHVVAVEIVARDARCDRTLLVEDVRGQTVLTLVD